MTSSKQPPTSTAWVRALFVDLATEAGAKDPAALAQQLIVLYDGAGISAWMDHDPSVAAASRSIAQMLVDAAIRPSKTMASLADHAYVPAPTSEEDDGFRPVS